MTNGDRSSDSKIAMYLGLGSNVGDREENLREAIKRIRTLGLEIVRESSIYETEPVGFTDQPWFLNQVIETKIPGGLILKPGVLGDPQPIASIEAGRVLSALLRIEREMGREPTMVNGPRVIDIDLLLYGDLVIKQGDNDADLKERNEDLPLDASEIVVPHPRMHLRRFVLEPLCEIAPGILHPVLKNTCCELLASVDDDSSVRPLNKVG